MSNSITLLCRTQDSGPIYTLPSLCPTLRLHLMIVTWQLISSEPKWSKVIQSDLKWRPHFSTFCHNFLNIHIFSQLSKLIESQRSKSLGLPRRSWSVFGLLLLLNIWSGYLVIRISFLIMLLSVLHLGVHLRHNGQPKRHNAQPRCGEGKQFGGTFFVFCWNPKLQFRTLICSDGIISWISFDLLLPRWHTLQWRTQICSAGIMESSRFSPTFPSPMWLARWWMSSWSCQRWSNRQLFS